MKEPDCSSLAALAIASLIFLTACSARGKGIAGPSPPPPAPPVPLSAECRGRLELADDKIRFEAFVAVIPPDRVFAEIAGRLGPPRAVLSVRGDRLAILFPSRREFVLETATPDVYEALIGMRIDTAALAAILGSAGISGERTLSVDGGPGLTLRGAAEELDVIPRGRSAGSFRSLHLKFKDIEMSGAGVVDEDLFSVDIPAGWRRIAIDPAGAGGPVLFP